MTYTPRPESERKDVYTRVTERIISDLEQGVRTWLKPWHVKHAAGKINIPLRHNGTPYRGMNILLLWGEAIRVTRDSALKPSREITCLASECIRPARRSSGERRERFSSVAVLVVQSSKCEIVEDTFRPHSRLRGSTLGRSIAKVEPFVSQILDHHKTWEIRGSRTNIQETIALIASGSGTVVGVCELVECIGPLTARAFKENARKAGMLPEEAKLGYYQKTYAWVVENPIRFKKPIPYSHPSGAIIWVTLDEAVEKSIRRNPAFRQSRPQRLNT